MNAPELHPAPWRAVPTRAPYRRPDTIRMDIVSDGAEFSPSFVAGDLMPEDADFIVRAKNTNAEFAALALTIIRATFAMVDTMGKIRRSGARQACMIMADQFADAFEASAQRFDRDAFMRAALAEVAGNG